MNLDGVTFQHVAVADYKEEDSWYVFGNSSSSNCVKNYPLYSGQTPSYIAKVSNFNNSTSDTITSSTFTETATSDSTATQNNTQINFTSDEQKDVFTKIKDLVGTGDNGLTTSSFATSMSNYIKEYCINNYELDSNEGEELRKYIYNNLTSDEAKEFLDENLHVNNSDEDFVQWADYIIDLVKENLDITTVNFTSDEQKDIFTKIKDLVGTGDNGLTTSSFATSMSNYIKEYCINNYELDSNEGEELRKYIYNNLTSDEAKEFLDENLHINNSDEDFIQWADYIIELVVEKTSDWYPENHKANAAFDGRVYPYWEHLTKYGWFRITKDDIQSYLDRGKSILIMGYEYNIQTQKTVANQDLRLGVEIWYGDIMRITNVAQRDGGLIEGDWHVIGSDKIMAWLYENNVEYIFTRLSDTQNE